MIRQRSSLRVQLIVLTVLSLLILAGTLEFIRFFQQRDALINAERRVGLTLIRSVSTTINSVRAFISTLSDISELDVRLAELVEQNDNIDFIAVVTPDGIAIFHSAPAYQGEPIIELARLSDSSTVEKVIPGYGDVYLTSVTFDSSDLREPKQFSIVVASGAEPILGLLYNTAISSVLVTVLITVVAAVTIIVFMRSFLIRPVEQLTGMTNAIAAGDLSQRTPLELNNEIGQLAHSFNSMADQLTLSIDEMKKARDNALAAQRVAQENSRLKSEFLATMSHELRTPLNAIEGFTGIMLANMAGVSYNAKAEHYLKKIQSNSHRLLNLINDFLDLSRIESGRMELAHLPMSPVEMTQRWRDNLSVLADEKGLAFDVTIDPNLPQTMYGDEESISKIAVNLVSNAIKFTEKGRVTLDLMKRGDQMALQVSDTGIGIPPHAREFIFDEFRQVDQSSKRKYGGTGLGLAIVQKLSREMGGTVTLQSEVGVGSVFTVVLPIHIEEPVAN